MPKEFCHSFVWCGSCTDNLVSFTETAESKIKFYNTVYFGIPEWAAERPRGLIEGLHTASTDALATLGTIRQMRQQHELVRRYRPTAIIYIYSLLYYAHLFDSTDPRDKIFGLSSLVSEQGLQSLAPNYDAGAHEIYFGLECDLIQRDRKLDILGFYATRGDFLLPSWVPDWTASNMPKPFPRKILDSDYRSESSKRLYYAASDTDFDGFLDKSAGILHAQGFEFDTIFQITLPRCFNSDRVHDISRSWHATALAPSSNYISG